MIYHFTSYVDSWRCNGSKFPHYTCFILDGYESETTWMKYLRRKQVTYQHNYHRGCSGRPGVAWRSCTWNSTWVWWPDLWLRLPSCAAEVGMCLETLRQEYLQWKEIQLLPTTTKSTKNIQWKKMVSLTLVARSWLLWHLFCYPKSVNYHNQFLSIPGRDFSNLCGADKTRVIACGILVD